MKTGIELIAAERERQIKVERFSAEQDDGYTDNELGKAADSYLAAVITPDDEGDENGKSRPAWDWPWDKKWWKPSDDPIRNLVKAGALIAAEIDRLQRLKRDQEETPNDIWKDPNVKSALKAGRAANDIMVLACPKCSRYGYYNQGSSFWCRFCKASWECLSEGEEPSPDRPYICLDIDHPITLADTVTDTTEGYHNETRPGDPKS